LQNIGFTAILLAENQSFCFVSRWETEIPRRDDQKGTIMKLLIETGSERHSTSSAKLHVRYHGGEFDGQYLYQVKGRKISADWDTNTHARWVTTVYEIPSGQEIEIEGHGRTGDRDHASAIIILRLGRSQRGATHVEAPCL
jgi:hypothetical protein